MRLLALVALCIWLVTSAVPCAAADGVPPDPALVAVENCQKRIKRIGARFVRLTLRGLEACTSEILDCAPGDQLCIAAAGASCRTVLRKLDKEERRLVRGVRSSCSRRLVSFDEVLSATGLGYEGVTAECEAILDQQFKDVRALARCVARQHQCQAEKLLDVERPRAHALLAAAGLQIDPSSCLTDHGGAGGTPRPGGVGKAILRCSKTIAKAGATLVDKRREGTDRCVDRVFACVKLHPADARCLDKARAGCNRDFKRMAAADARLERAIFQRCPPAALPFALLAEAEVANLAALAPMCAALGESPLTSLEQYGVCLLRHHACAVEELVRVAAPRSAELLGLVGRPLASSFCPTGPPAPTPTAPPRTETPTPQGTRSATRTPQPGETATPSATPPSATRTLTPGATRTPTPGPTEAPVCGNNVVEGDEECDGTDLDGNDCEDLCDQDDEGGTLRCRANCTYNFSGCPPPRDCEAL